MLPSPNHQTRHHCAKLHKEALAKALQNDGITAIQGDLVGSIAGGGCGDESIQSIAKAAIAIMAHPPHRTSNLTVQSFLEHLFSKKVVCESTSTVN